MVYAIRKNKETTGAMLRRFTRMMQQSGVLLAARKTRFYTKKQNSRARRASALRRLVKRAEHERLVKLGRIKKNPRKKFMSH